jgi:hypothetical protein
MDILTIAAREGNRAYEEAEGTEAKAAAYYKIHQATLQRGRKAEELLEAGAISPNGKAGSYYVQSQSGNGRYTADIEAGECDCPDHLQRGTYCKHLQAAELFADAQGDPLQTADGEQVVLEVKGYARGRQVLDKKLARVRVNGGSYRKAKSEDFEAALAWLMSEGYELASTAGPRATMGTVTVRYIYRKPEAIETHDDALPVQGPRRRDRLFKAA